MRHTVTSRPTLSGATLTFFILAVLNTHTHQSSVFIIIDCGVWSRVRMAWMVELEKRITDIPSQILRDSPIFTHARFRCLDSQMCKPQNNFLLLYYWTAILDCLDLSTLSESSLEIILTLTIILTPKCPTDCRHFKDNQINPSRKMPIH